MPIENIVDPSIRLKQSRSQAEREEFYEVIENVKYKESVIAISEWNEHVGMNRTGTENVLGAHAIVNRN